MSDVRSEDDDEKSSGIMILYKYDSTTSYVQYHYLYYSHTIHGDGARTVNIICLLRFTTVYLINLKVSIHGTCVVSIHKILFPRTEDPSSSPTTIQRPTQDCFFATVSCELDGDTWERGKRQYDVIFYSFFTLYFGTPNSEVLFSSLVSLLALFLLLIQPNLQVTHPTQPNCNI